MTAQVVVGAVCNAPQLAPVGEREGVLDVGGGAAVEGQLGGLVVAQAQIFFLDAKAQQPVLAVVLPVGEPLQVGVGLAEELALHLLKLAGTEGEVARGDLVAERLADLADAEGQLAAGRALDVRKVDEDALRGLGAQVAGGGGILGHADGGLEHQVELADGGEVVLAADGADDLGVGGDELVHLSKVMASTSTPLPCSHSEMSLSARWRLLQARQSSSGSEKLDTWPVVTQVWGFIRMAASSPTL